MSVFKNHLFFLICLISAVQAWGQAARSPFTRQGIGEPYSNALINTQGMAGVGVAQPQFWYLNNQNPALLAYNNYTVFQAGLVAERKTIRMDSASEKSAGGNMNYLVTGFPVKPGRWSTSLGLMPYSAVKYKVIYIGDIANSTDSIGVIEEGSGGFTQLYWSNGVRINRYWAVGLKIGYIFGSIKSTYSNQLIRSNQPINYFATMEEKQYARDFAFTAGVSYSKDSLFANNRYRVSFGATYGLQANLNTKLRGEFYRYTASTGPIDSDRDTLYTVNGNTRIPPALTAGASLSYGSKWNVGTEFSYQDWSSFKGVNQTGEVLGKSWRAAVGAETTPDLLSPSYIKRVTYRVGLSYEQTPFLVDRNDDPATVDNQNVKDLGINFGFSLPAGRSSLDLAFRYGKRGNKTDTLLEEDYFRIFFGITFNDTWFIKRKFD
jgi:hypothetical protein